MSDEMMLWEANETAIVPASATTGPDIVKYARQLSKREAAQVQEALKAESYEMATTFIWTKTMSGLKKQLATLGMEFIGEMLDRADISATSAIEHTVTDYEAIQLAEDLGMVTTTNALRLRHSLETLAHFARETDVDDGDEMAREEALLCLRACVQGILGRQQVSVAMRFAEFRSTLEGRIFSETDEEMRNLAASPYFFKRTTLSVLLALVKSAKGAQLDNALGNINIILPMIWKQLRKPEKWQTGQTYAEIYNSGKEQAVAGVKKALLKVRGFDFVPENLRSTTFLQAAQKVIEAHDDFNNFHNEPAPMTRLAALGSSIPTPAFHVCMRATLCVFLGNTYGHSWAAEEPARRLLGTLSKDRWEYFLGECLPTDKRILEKFLADKPRQRWLELVSNYKLGTLPVSDSKVRKLLSAGSAAGMGTVASELIRSLGYRS